jgi:hypothetical protein
MTELSASLIEASVVDVTSDNIREITDEVLFKKLKVLNLNPGPITPTTRGLYERKLLNHLSGNASVNATVSEDKSTVTAVSGDEPIESIHHNLYESKATAAASSHNDSFDSYSRQISSIRSRAPLHQQADSNFFILTKTFFSNEFLIIDFIFIKEISTETEAIRRSKSSSANLMLVVFAFCIVLIAFYFYLVHSF